MNLYSKNKEAELKKEIFKQVSPLTSIVLDITKGLGERIKNNLLEKSVALEAEFGKGRKNVPEYPEFRKAPEGFEPSRANVPEYPEFRRPPTEKQKQAGQERQTSKYIGELRKAHIPTSSLLTEKEKSERSAMIVLASMAPSGKQFPFKEMPRKFIKSVKDSPIAQPELIAKLKDSFYSVRNTDDAIKQAKTIVENFPNQARAMIAGDKLDDTGMFVGQAFIDSLQKAGDYEGAAQMAQKVARAATESGRQVQALSAINKLGSRGILRFAQNIIDDANKVNPNLKLTLSPVKAKELVKKAYEIAKLSGREKELATKLLLKNLAELVPSTLGEKISTVQNISLLLNPRTLIRNVGGNTLFAGLENISQTVGTALDVPLSKITGTRTTKLPSLTTQAKGFGKGLKAGYQEAVLGLPPAEITKFDLPRRSVFAGQKVMGSKLAGKTLQSLEKSLNVALRAPDKAAYTAVFDDSIRSQMKLLNASKAKQGLEILTKPTSEILENAHNLGLYRTFQDESVMAGVMQGLKGALNKVGIKGWGLGDLIIKYPRTPGNILARAGDYSPIGIGKAILEIGKPIIKGRTFNQKAFVDNLSRGLTGTAAIGTAAVLTKLGLITPPPSKNRKVRELEEMTGEGGFDVNVTALRRFISSGLNKEAVPPQKDDVFVNYDWAQPAAINIALGARLAKSNNPKETISDIGDILSVGTETFVEQPLISGVRRFFGGYTPMEGAISTVKRGPATFIPSLLSQTAQLMDTEGTISTITDNAFQETLNVMKGRIPGLRQTLPKKRDIFGKPIIYEKAAKGMIGKTIEHFFSPAFVKRYNPPKEAMELARLFQQTGETRILPNVAGRTLRYKNKSYKLKGEEISRLQELYGTVAKNALSKITDNQVYRRTEKDEDKAIIISKALTKLNGMVRDRFMAERIYEEIKEMPREKKIKYLKNMEKEKILDEDLFNQLKQVLDAKGRLP